MSEKIPPTEKDIALKETNPWSAALGGSQREATERELYDMYAQNVPQDVLFRFFDLAKRQSENFDSGDTVAQAATSAEIEAFVAEQRAQIGAKETRQEKNEESFDPHSVPTAVSIEEQQRNAEMRGLLAKAGVIPQESVPELDVDISAARAPQYEPRPEMQADMDTLHAEPVSGATDELSSLKEKFKDFAGGEAMVPVEGFKEIPDSDLDRALGRSDDKEKIEPSIDMNRLDELLTKGPEISWAESPHDEKTPREWRKTLRDLIGNAKEKVTSWASSGERLIRRNEELDAELEKLGGIERRFRSWGEKYNKLPFKYKLAIGASLGLGTAATAGTLAVALPLLGIGVQRVAGLATMYLKYEKNSHDEAWGKNKEWGKQKALLKAGAYTILLGLTMKEAIEYASQTELAHAAQTKVEEWLGSMLGHDTSVTEAPARQEVIGKITAAPETVAAVPVEMPSVHASAGHGYEYMMKQLWKELQGKRVALPMHADPNSDIARLLAADEKSIDTVVHQIASDSRHGFDSSVRIDLDAQMTIGANGELHLLTDRYDYTFAPTHAHVVPTPQAEAPAVSDEAFSLYHDEAQVPAMENAEAAPVADITLETPKEPPQIDLTHEQDLAAEKLAHANVAEQAHIAVNSFGVEVSASAPHIYADAAGEHFFVYGGSPQEKASMILKYLTENPDKTIFNSDDNGAYRIPWNLVEGEVVPGMPAQTSGFFGFFSSWMKAPEPEEFAKIIK